MNNVRTALSLAISFAAAAALAQDHDPNGYKRFPTMAAEAAKYFTPVKGMSAEDRLRAYDQRLQMEANSPFAKLMWRSVGPETQSGRVTAIHAPADKPDSLFVAFATGGLWRTDDDGITWTSLFDHESAYGIGAFDLSRDGKTIWVGTGEANNQRTSYSGTGVFKSVDGGKTWQNMGLHESHHIARVLIDPKDANTVYVAAMGHLYSENPERGVYKTTDGGKTWRQILKANDTTGANDLAIDPRNPKVLYANMVDRQRRAWDYLETGDGAGVYKTEDGGDHWSLMPGLPHGSGAARTGLAISPSSPNVLYAFADSFQPDLEVAYEDEQTPSGELTPHRFLLLDDASFVQVDKAVLAPFFSRYVGDQLSVDNAIQQVKDKKLTVADIRALIEKRNATAFQYPKENSRFYRSDDSGKTWRLVVTQNVGQLGGYYYQEVFVDPKDPNDVFACGVLLYRSRDGGKTWSPAATSAHVDFHCVWFDARDSHHIGVGNDGGLYVTGNDGGVWRHLNNLAVGQFTTIAVDDSRPFNIVGGLQDNGTMMGPSTHEPGFSDPNQWKTVGGGDGSAVAVDSRDDSAVIYTASQFGAHGAQNLKTHVGWNARPGNEAQQPNLRFNWVSPITLSPFDQDIVYVGAQRLMRSFDQGRHYSSISPDLTKNREQGNVPFATIKDVSESPLRFGLIYVGCDDGNVQMTPDGGFQWIAIPTPTPNKWVSRVVASKWAVGRVYVTQSGYREDDFAPYVYVSEDFGKTWRSIASNLPAETINVIREDPDRSDTLYVGTDMGVFVSMDSGKSWDALPGGIPHTPVHDIAIQARDHAMAIATHARSVWVLSLSPIEDLTNDIRAKDLYFWPIADTDRQANLEFQGSSPIVFGNGTAPSAEVRAYSSTAGKGTLRIKDAQGKVVKEVAGVDVVRGINYLSIDLELTHPKPGTANPKSRVAKSAQDALADPYAAERGTYVKAGDYTLELTLGSHVVSGSMHVANGGFGGRRRRGGDDEPGGDGG